MKEEIDIFDFDDSGPYQQPNPDWQEHWQDMPEYVQEANGPWKTIKIHFRNEDDYSKPREFKY